MSSRLPSLPLRLIFSPSSRPTLRPVLSPSAAPHRTIAGGPQRTQPLKIWPFVAILLLGSSTYVFMVKSRVGTENNSSQKRPRNLSPNGQ